MKLKLIAVASLLLCVVSGYADEGMWLLGRLNKNKQVKQIVKEMGLKTPVKKIYNPGGQSLSNAIVSFGGFCSGVVVSADGLVFTNHHCGFSSIQQHSTVAHDYLKEGFVAQTLSEELPNPELYVRFLVRTEDVTKRVLKGVSPTMKESERRQVIDSIASLIAHEVSVKDSTLVGMVDTYYAGNEYWLSVYRDYTDVRLVFAPPSSVGKFGWDTDNWVWPRHTGDFSVFRIYADKDNKPADYSPQNVPYHPAYVAPVSLDGYQKGGFCMTLGYPGSTERFLSSYGIEEKVTGLNQAMIDVRGVKQAIWKRSMAQSEELRIKYAAKYDESSNYWKNSIGENEAITKLKVLDKKRASEEALRSWIQSRPEERDQLHLLSSLALDYGSRKEVNRALSYFGEAFMNGPELIQLALEILNFDFGAEQELVVVRLKKLIKKYEDLDLGLDKEVFKAMLTTYRSKVSPAYLPAMYQQIDTLYQGHVEAYVDSLYAQSSMTSLSGIKRFLERDSTYHLMDDPAIALSIDLVVKFYELNQRISTQTEQIERNERLFNAAMRRMYGDYSFYPDANATMRFSFGTIGGYSPFDGASYSHYTTVKGIFEKVKAHAGDTDFAVQPEVLACLSSTDFGRYADQAGDMRVCFISNNDITGGNSGSPMFNSQGELIGLAFDGNWEAMSSDLVFEPDYQRCIGVDVRYMLFMIDKYGKASRLIEEIDASRKLN